MGKNPAFLFYIGDWLKEVGLQMADMETRGVWIQMLCCMANAKEQGKLTGTVEEMSRLLGCETNVLTRNLTQLTRLGIGNVSWCNDEVTVISRRMYRDYLDKQTTRLRVQRYRGKRECNADVTDTVTDKKRECNIDTSVSVTLKENIYVEVGCAWCVYWTYCEAINRNGNQYKMTPAKKSKIMARLKDCSVGEIKNAIIACSLSQYHMGKNDNNRPYNDLITNILKSREKVEWWNARSTKQQPKFAT